MKSFSNDLPNQDKSQLYRIEGTLASISTKVDKILLAVGFVGIASVLTFVVSLIILARVTH